MGTVQCTWYPCLFLLISAPDSDELPPSFLSDLLQVSDTVAAGCLALAAASVLSLCTEGIEAAGYLRVTPSSAGEEAGAMDPRRGPAAALGSPQRPQGLARRRI